jgi:hypothetical protein
LTLSYNEILKLIDDYERESRAIKEEAIKMCWYMRGGLSYEDAMLLSETERKLVSTIIKDNLETPKKSKLPFF